MGDGFADEPLNGADDALRPPDAGAGNAGAAASSSTDSGAASSSTSGARKPAASGSKRGPGRPPKSGGSGSKAGRGDGSAVRLRVDEAPHAARPQQKPSKPKTNDATGDATQATTALLQLAELAAVATVGPHAALNPIERAMVEPALIRTLARMDAATVARYGALADPIVLALGLGMWGFRCYVTYGAQQQARAARQAESADRARPGSGAPASAPAEPPKATTEEAASVVAPTAPLSGQDHGRNGYAPVSPLILAHVDDGLGPVI